ncbi:MAG: hypothetical protein WCN87_00660 [Chlamydiota bacterium]
MTITTANIAALQMAILIESYKMYKQQARSDSAWIRDVAEKQIMQIAGQTEKERSSQALWTLVGGVVAGVLKVGSAAVLGASTALPAITWLEPLSKGAYAMGDLSSGISQGGASLQSASVGKSEAHYEAAKRLQESVEKMRQSSQSCDQMVMQIIEQLVRSWQQRSF